MDNQYYQEYYKLERKHWWFRARAKILNDQISKIASGDNLKILNVGAAMGATTELLTKFGTVTSIEYESTCCKFLNEELHIPAIEASITDLPFPDNSFDLVCAFDVIEHIEDDNKAIFELKRVTKPGGIICCTVPTFMFLWSKHDNVNHHKRRYTAKSFSALFLREGTTIFSSYFNSILFIPIAIFRILSKLLPENFLRNGAGSDFTLGNIKATGRIPFEIMASERKLLNRYVSLPFGVSFLLLWKK